MIVTSECGAVVNENCTYIQNVNAPGPQVAAGTCSWTIRKCSPDVCLIRLDFITADIAPPNTIVGAGGDCAQDMVSFT